METVRTFTFRKEVYPKRHFTESMWTTQTNFKAEESHLLIWKHGQLSQVRCDSYESVCM